MPRKEILDFINRKGGESVFTRYTANVYRTKFFNQARNPLCLSVPTLNRL